MTRLSWTPAFCGAILLITATATHAQRPGDDRSNRSPGPPGGFGGPPGFLLMEALDADKDGKLTAQEIDNAVTALRKLDKNQDGKLSREEIGWPPAGGFRGFGGPRGGFPGFGGGGRGGFPGFGRGGRPGFGGPGSGRPQRPDPDAETSARGRGSDASPSESNRNPRRRRGFFSSKQLQQLDRDGDGKITKEEIPRRMQELILNRVDTNKDGAIDKDGLAKLGKQQ